jgi:molybdopterin-containing oxidoreductase family membrane subunit
MLKSIRILLILIIPTAFAIHTVTSWLLAVTVRPGWDSTIFGPYFLTGAFVAGSAAVVIVMYFVRSNYKLDKYLTTYHFDMMGRLIVLVSLVYLYFNINEFLVPAYKLKTADAIHLHEIFVGDYALMFWSVQILGLVLPIILLLIRFFRKPLPLLIISFVILVAAWFKRYIIVVPTQVNPFLPKQYEPHEWMVYHPTIIESAITMGTILLAVIIITLLVKLFPVIPIWEMAEEEHEAKNNEPHKIL